MDQRVSLLTFGVADLARARAFYARLGWRESAAGNDAVAFFQLGGIALALYGRDALARDAGVAPAAGSGAVSVAHNVRTRDEVDTLMAEVEAAGGRITAAPADAAWGGRVGYFTDPDGILWEVAWNPLFPIDRDGGLHLPD